MNASSPPELRGAVEALWRVAEPIPGNIFAAPTFVDLRQVCQARYPNAGSSHALDFALSHALQALGFRWTAEGPPSQQAIPADIAADRINTAFRQTRSHRVHLCPLDQADEIPSCRFGPNLLRDFTADQLHDLVDRHGVMRQWPERRFDSRRFSQFSWLVVEEFVDLPGEPGARALPSLFINLDKDFGRIEPHKPRFPPAVEIAIFALLTAPWEDVVRHSDVNWRPFRIPWVYTLDDDLFARIPVPPDADSLTWEPDFHQDHDGEWIEFERPFRLPLNDDAEAKTNYLNDETWRDLERARSSPLFAGPLLHFLVRAFATDGIDEFLAHITVIEAALGAPVDHDVASRPRRSRSKNPGATARVAARLGILLEEPGAGERYTALFAERSSFLHGRTMADIPGVSRLEARRLARRCVCALIGAAISKSPPGSRDAFLDDLLQRSWSAT